MTRNRVDKKTELKKKLKIKIHVRDITMHTATGNSNKKKKRKMQDAPTLKKKLTNFASASHTQTTKQTHTGTNHKAEKIDVFRSLLHVDTVVTDLMSSSISLFLGGNFFKIRFIKKNIHDIQMKQISFNV